MGLCASVSSSSRSKTHEDYDTYGHENAVYYRGIFSGSNANGSSSSSKIGSTHSHPGSKDLNQDSAILYQGYGTEDGVLCAVFDGHGKNGHIVSKLVRNRLPTLLLNQRNALTTKTSCSPSSKQNLDLSSSSPNKNFIKREEAFASAFKVMDKEIKLLDSLDCSCSGTTASVVVKQGNDLVIANLGDTRVVLGTRTENGIEAVQLTTDLKPGVPSEAERIRKCNGRVLALKDEPHIQRVWLPNDDSPGLAMSRAFGDFVLKNHGIIAIPDVSFHRISPNDEFLVIASDGVWDVLSNDQVMSVVSSAREGDAAAKAVVDAAIALWKRRFANSKRDDCTVICLFFSENGDD